MAALREGERGLFFVGVLASGEKELAEAARALEDAFERAYLGSPVWRFDNTDYYRKELGPLPLRAFLAFPGLFATGNIAEWKIATNALERELADKLDESWPRPINLDPGYVTQAKVVLASAKNFSHRVHLGGGIYAEVTLMFKHGGWRTFPWTFPDFASERYHAFFSVLREEVGRLVVRKKTATTDTCQRHFAFRETNPNRAGLD